MSTYTDILSALPDGTADSRLTEDEYIDSEVSHLEWDAWRAYVELVGEDYALISNAEEAYAGEWESDEAFAQNLAEELGLMDNVSPDDWPYNNIDWTGAAVDIMHDYSESNGHYFRDI
jgi:antirestriction protein